MEVAIGIESLIFSSIIIGNISEFCLFISISCSRDLTVLLFHLSSCLREIPCHEVQTPGYYRKSLSMKNTPRGKKCSLRPRRYRPFYSTIELLWTLQCVVRAILLVFTTVRLGQSRVSVIFSRWKQLIFVRVKWYTGNRQGVLIVCFNNNRPEILAWCLILLTIMCCVFNKKTRTLIISIFLNMIFLMSNYENKYNDAI